MPISRRATIGAVAAVAAQYRPTLAQGRPQSTLSIASVPAVMESSVLLRAAKLWRDGAAITVAGGVANLWPSKNPVRTETVDLAGNSEAQMLHFSALNPGCRMILTVVEGLYHVAGRRSAGISDAASLKGKRIATLAGTSAAYFLETILAGAGLSAADATIVSMPVAAMPGALAAKDVDAMAIWEPEPRRAATLLGQDYVEFRPAGAYRELYSLYTTADLLADVTKRKQIVSFVRALKEASREAVDSPNELQAPFAERSGYSMDLIRSAWREHDFVCDMPADILEVLAKEEAWLAPRESRKPRLREELATLIDTSVLKEASVPL